MQRRFTSRSPFCCRHSPSWPSAAARPVPHHRSRSPSPDADRAAVETQAAQPRSRSRYRRPAGGHGRPVASDTQTPEPSPHAPAVVHSTQPGTREAPPTSSRTARPRPWPTSDGRSVTTTPQLARAPFSADSMEYQAHLDLTRVEYAVGAPWIYFTLFVEGLPPRQRRRLRHRNRHGQGRPRDWLIAAMPRRLDVDDDGVQAYRDTNNDVGASRPMLTDAPVTSGTGYDELVSTKATAGSRRAWIAAPSAPPRSRSPSRAA